MVTGRALIEHGWPESPTIGLALAAARKLRAAGIIHRSAWNRNSANFAFVDSANFAQTEFYEVRSQKLLPSIQADPFSFGQMATWGMYSGSVCLDTYGAIVVVP